MNECPHLHVIPTRFTMSNGVVMVTMQCQACGQRCGDGKNKDYDLASLPEFDRELRDRAWQERQEEWERTRALSDLEWWVKYDAYLASPEWNRLRRSVIVRDHFLCQGCFAKVTDTSAHVHHRSYVGYNRTGHSFAFECVTLCRKCHLEYHGQEDEREIPF